MSFQEEQERFQKEIEKHFISLFNLIEKIQQEQKLELKEAGLYLLTRLNKYFNHSEEQLCYELAEPPFKEYTLPPISHYDLINALNFLSRNGRFRSVKNAKKYGLLLSELEVAFSDKPKVKEENEPNPSLPQNTVDNVVKEYHPSERETHLQMIAILAEELAKLTKKYKKANGLPNNSALANTIETIAKEIHIEAMVARSVDTYRRRLTEISKFYKGE